MASFVLVHWLVSSTSPPTANTRYSTSLTNVNPQSSSTPVKTWILFLRAFLKPCFSSKTILYWIFVLELSIFTGVTDTTLPMKTDDDCRYSLFMDFIGVQV